MDGPTLQDAISEVCPVATTKVIDGNDRATWSFTPAAGATQAQIDAGNNVIATIPVDYKPSPVPDPQSEVLYAHENRLRTLEGQPPLSLGEFLTKIKAKQ